MAKTTRPYRFWFHSKKDEGAHVFSSIKAICENFPISENVLYGHFSRRKRETYEDDDYRIVKTQVIFPQKDSND